MGANKLLMPWNQATIVRTVITHVIEAGMKPLIVLGCDAQEVKRNILTLVPDPGSIVINTRWQDGMVTSIQTGVQHAGIADYWLMHGDMPLLTGAMLTEITAVLRQSTRDDCDVMFPVCEGQVGHPVWIRHTLRDAILALPSGERLRPFLKTQRWCSAEVPYHEITVDIDTRDVYSKYQQ